jgi:2'-5' RNA ligase
MRLFIAVEIPHEATARLVGWQEEYLSGDRALRLCPEGQLHITLAFLGQMDERHRDRAAEELQKLEGASAFEAAAAGLIGLPKGRAPRVIAAAIEEPQGLLASLHDRLVAGLVAGKLYKREKRPYFPHVTVARARGRPRINLAEIHPETFKFTAVRVTLYNSILKPSGALHEALKTVQLI